MKRVGLAAFTALFIWILCLRFITLRMHTRLGALARSLALAEAAAQDEERCLRNCRVEIAHKNCARDHA